MSAREILRLVLEVGVALASIAAVVVACYSCAASSGSVSAAETANGIASSARDEAKRANDIAANALSEQNDSDSRALADKVLIATKRIKKPGPNVVEVRVQNYGVQRLGIPQFELRDPPNGKTHTAILTAELEACQEAVFTVSGTWWRAVYHPYLVFKDGKGRIWKLHEASEAVRLHKVDRELRFDADTFALADQADKIDTVRDRKALQADKRRTLQPCG